MTAKFFLYLAVGILGLLGIVHALYMTSPHIYR